MEIKLPLYNILNMLLTGFVFWAGIITLYPVALMDAVTGEIFLKLSTLPQIILLLCLGASTYEIGFILNRAGSIIVEPILIKYKFSQFPKSYFQYLEASKEFTMLEILSREYALSRTSTIEFLLLAVWSAGICKWWLGGFYFAIAVIFLFSCIKHSAKITAVLEAYQKNYKSNQ